MELSVGEALISFLDTNGSPSITNRAFILPPTSQIGPITPDERKQLIESSLVAGVYEQTVDRESAFEMLQARAGSTDNSEKSSTKQLPSNQEESSGSIGQQVTEGILGGLGSLVFGSTGKRGGHHDGMISAFAKSAARSVGTSVAREITRGLLGSLLGSTTTKRKR